MAGRPLNPEMRVLKGDAVSIRVPEANGSTKRVTRRFPSREQAERFLAALFAVWGTDLPLPDTDHYQSTRQTRAQSRMPDGFAPVALAWWKKFYPDEYDNPETADSVGNKVRAHLIPFFAPRVDHISEITYSDVEDFVDYKAGKRDQLTNAQAVIAEAREYTLVEAAEWTKRGKSTIRKAWLAKKFPHAYLDTTESTRGVVKIPVGDLITAGYFAAEKAQEVPYGYSRKNVNEMLSKLRRIFVFARANGLMDRDPSEGIKAKDPVRDSRSAQPKSEKPIFLFDLALSKRIASHMHIHHQMAFWLMRGVGLRISEAYGIELGDIYRDEDRMVIRIWQQGGKTFKVKNDEGQKVLVNKKLKTKSKSSTRVIPIPTPVAELIEVYIAAFHEGSTPTTPLLKPSKGLGQSALRDALTAANELEHHGAQDVGFNATPHIQRAFFTTDVDEFPSRARSIYLGHLVQDHEGGAAITEAVYTLRRKNVSRLLVVADFMGDLIMSEIGSLVDPTPAQRLVPTHVAENALQREHAIEVLDAAGLIGTTEDAGETVIDVREAAEMLAVSTRRVRELSREGILERRPISGSGRTRTFGVTLSSVKARLSTDQQLTTRHEMRSEFGLTYVELDRLITKLGVAPVQTNSLGHRYSDEEINKIRQHFKVQSATTKKTVSVPKAVLSV